MLALLVVVLNACGNRSLPRDWPLTAGVVPTGAQITYVRCNLLHTGRAEKGIDKDWLVGFNCTMTTEKLLVHIESQLQPAGFLWLDKGGDTLSTSYISSDGLLEVDVIERRDHSVSGPDFEIAVKKTRFAPVYFDRAKPLSRL